MRQLDHDRGLGTLIDWNYKLESVIILDDLKLLITPLRNGRLSQMTLNGKFRKIFILKPTVPHNCLLSHTHLSDSMVSHGSHKIGFPWLESVIMTSIASLLQYVRYKGMACSPLCDIRAALFVGMLGDIFPTEQMMLGWNNFHPASTRYSTHWQLGYSFTSEAGVSLYAYLWVFLNIYAHKKKPNPI